MGIEFEVVDHGIPDGTEPGATRRRVAAGVGALMLIAAAGGIGFGLGNSAASDASSAAVAPLSPTDTAPRTIAPETTMLLQPSVTEAIQEEASTESAGDAEASFESIPAATTQGWSVFGDQPMELLAERTTDSGLILRAHLGELWDHEMHEMGYADEFEGWEPPTWCFESGQIRVALGGGEATGPAVVDVGAVSWWTDPFQGRAIGWLTLGRADANPYRVVVVQAPADVTTVTVNFADGSTDSTAPQNGVALLAVAGAPETIERSEGDGYSWSEERPQFGVTFDSAGDAVTVDEAQTPIYNNPQFQASCSPPPPALPAPGEQPADPAGDEQTINDMMATLYGNNGDEDFGGRELIHEPDGVAEARDEVAEGLYEEAASSAEAVVEELVFTTPTEAWFRYRIETINGLFGPRFGVAVNIDGDWKITRDTICQDLQLAGGTCGDGVAEIQPPS